MGNENNRLLESTEEYAEWLLDQMRNTSIDDPMHDKLQKAYEAITRDITNLKAGDASEAARITAESSRYAWVWQLGGQVLGSFVQPMVGHLLNRKNVKSVTDYEKGDILMTKSMKFMK